MENKPYTLTNMHLVKTAATTHTDEKYIKLSPPSKQLKLEMLENMLINITGNIFCNLENQNTIH